MESAKLITIGAWAIYWTGFLLIKKFCSVKNKIAAVADPESKKPLIWLIVLQFAVYFLFWARIGEFKSASVLENFHSVIFLTGVVLLIVGVVFSIFSRYYLGSNWGFLTFTSIDRPFVKNGPYSFIRHPIYLGLFIIWIGASFVFFNWIGIASGFVVFLPLLYWRADIEERNLINFFGQNYLNYASHLGIIFPKIKTLLPLAFRFLLRK